MLVTWEPSSSPRRQGASGTTPSQLGPATQQIDDELCQIAEAFEWLTLVTPRDVDSTWKQFAASEYEREPQFVYPVIEVDLGALRKRLLALPLGKVEDPLIEALLAEKQREVDRHLTLLDLRGTSGFLQASLDLFGDADEDLVELAGQILDLLGSAPRHPSSPLLAGEVLTRVRQELEEYVRRVPDFPLEVVVCDELVAGMMVSQGVLYIDRDLVVPARRLSALLHHEIGTHVLTFFNGSRQPLRQFRNGLAHYDTLQEGLGVLGEFLAEGLTPGRLRILAARVLAVSDLVGGRSFVDVFARLRNRCGLGPRAAFGVAVRVFRGGGLTKDALYLRGLQELLTWLRKGKSVEDLFVGKLALQHVEAVCTLRDRGVLLSPAVLPRYLWDEAGGLRLARCRSLDIHQLAREVAATRPQG